MKVKVNDVELDLKPGTSAIDAIFAAGYDVPYFCSQEYMSPIGACRMCLAVIGAPRRDRDGNWILDEATGEPKIFYFPNPMATCTTAIMEGMVIDTLSEVTKKAQAGMMEMHLINHPLDCPTCDKGGACELQDRAYEYGTGFSRFVFDKRHNEKHHALSPLITLDRERCIHCKRCVRYFEEVPGDEVLDFIERGGHTFIGTAQEGLPSNFSGNITDICPVGALLDATSRFRGRNWEYHHTRSVGLDDCVGSAITIDSRTGRIERIKAALNTQVNKIWIDDGTRFGHQYVDSEARIRQPLIRRAGQLVPVSWEEAAEYVGKRLAVLRGDEVGFVARADITLEEAVALQSLAEHLESEQLEHFPRYNGSVIPARQATINELATADAILVFGDVSEEAPVLDLRIKDALKGVAPPELLPHGVPIADLRLQERMPRRREILTVAAPYPVSLMKWAGRSWRYPAGGEAALLAALVARAKGERAELPGLAAEEADALIAQLKAANNAVIVAGGLVLRSRAATAALAELAEVTGSKELRLGAMANSYGLEALGLMPKSGFNYHRLHHTALRALFISELNPASDAELALKLKQLELVVVHSMFHNETTAVAQVVLPAKSGYEKEGTIVNCEGRYLAVNPAPVDGGEAEDLIGVVRRLGEVMGVRLAGRSLRSARRFLNERLGVDLAALPDEGLCLSYRARREAPELPEVQGGNVLLVPRMARAEYLHLNPQLERAVGGNALVIHPADAEPQGLQQDDLIELMIGSQRRRLRVVRSEHTPEGLMLAPALPEQPIGFAQADMASMKRLQVALGVAS